MVSSLIRKNRQFGPQVPDMHAGHWAQKKIKPLEASLELDEGTEREEQLDKEVIEQILRPKSEMPNWAKDVLEGEKNAKGLFDYEKLFCQLCGTLFDLRHVGGQSVCRRCKFGRKRLEAGASEATLMECRAVIDYGETKHWMKKLDASNGPQRAIVEEPCPKCNHGLMFYWTQQLRSADEGQTVFYECCECSHRYSQNT